MTDTPILRRTSPGLGHPVQGNVEDAERMAPDGITEVEESRASSTRHECVSRLQIVVL
jgi:hypothetical protein